MEAGERVELGVTWTLGPLELGAGMDALARRSHGVRYAFLTALAIACGVAALGLVVAFPAARTTKVVLSLVAYALVVLPWTRHRAIGAVLWVTTPSLRRPFVLHAFSDRSMWIGNALADTEVRFAAYPTRLDSRDAFVFGSRENPLVPLVLPKRVFPQVDARDRFAEAALGETRAVAIPRR